MRCRAFKYPLYPTKVQRETLDRWLWVSRRLYNAALEQRRDWWHNYGASVDYRHQTSDLTDLRASDPEFSEAPCAVERYALRRLDKTFKAFFRRCKTGKAPGYPRFKGRDRYNSFSLSAGSGVSVTGNRVKLPKIGEIKFHKYREFEGRVLSVQVKRGPKNWSISFICDVGPAPEKVPFEQATQHATGIDLGLSSFVVLADGTHVQNPRFFVESEKLIAKRQRMLAGRRRGSKSRFRAKLLLGRAYEHVRNQRLDFARKLAALLYTNWDLVAHEDLDIHGLIESGEFSKSVGDAAWGVFVRCLTLKAEEAGKWAVPVDPRGTSQRCSSCGANVPKDLSVRVHRCTNCGLVLDRDHNAALNVLALGMSAARDPHESVEAPTETLSVSRTG